VLCMELGQYHITLNEEHVMVPELDAVVEAGLFLLVLAVCMFSLRVHCCLCCVITLLCWTQVRFVAKTYYCVHVWRC